ncbi:MAG: nucleotidyl transferase AbiEii/AbiGii toxin family protein [Zoogloeaceae bacterium]|jgi:hypothetical protein|nr:nucleotidyl transferase AbiEii/AbiGii toxin family protein [Zoogloeaceae bacterium]
MFRRLHHQRIAKILHAFDADLLQAAECYFGGGTAITLALDEYRESVDIDFLCASNDGYRILRNAVSNNLGGLLKTPLKHLREVRTDQYKIYTVLEIEEIPVKVELIREGRVSIQGALDPALNVPVLSRLDLYAQKLLANADRGLDRSAMSRDIIDLSMMIQSWGDIPKEAWNKACRAYGKQLTQAFQQSVDLISNPAYLADCLRKMHMDTRLIATIPATLKTAADRMPVASDTQKHIDVAAK